MNALEIQMLMQKQMGIEDSKKVLADHGKELLANVIRQPKNNNEIDLLIVSLQLLLYYSQYQSCSAQMSQLPQFKDLVRVLMHQCVHMKKSKLFPYYMGLLANLSIEENACLALALSIRKDEVLTIYRELIDAGRSALYYLENVSRFAKPFVSTELLNIVLGKLQKRDQQDVPVSQMLRNLFLLLRDNHELVKMYTPVVKPLILELTSEEFYQRYRDNLKIQEKDQKNVFAKTAKAHSDQAIFNIVESLILYVRLDKVAVKALYPQLRETHMYYTDKQGMNTLNDALNILIEHCLSDDLPEEPKKETQENNGIEDLD